MPTANTTVPASLQRILQGAQLPALPQSAIRLMELSHDPNNGPAEFAVPIEGDPGLAGQVLKFVNSSYFGFSREISNVKLAITLVGIRTIKNFALWSAVFSLMPNPRCGPFELKLLCQDSLRRALFARKFAKMLGLRETEEPFAAALLQDMAVPLLAKEMPNEYTDLIENRYQSHRRLSDLEQEHFGWNHAQAGAMIARTWNMPEGFARLVEHHVELDRLMDDAKAPPDELAVALSSILPAATDGTWQECMRFESAFNRLARGGSNALPELLAEIDREFVEFSPVLKLGTPAKQLTAFYDEMAAQPV